MEEVIPGIRHWQARHPNIGADVSSYLLTDTGTAIDPLLPDGEDVSWLGHRVERVVLTVRHHVRSAADFGAPIFVHRSGLHEFEGGNLDMRGYEAGDEIVPGIRVLPFGRICSDDAVLKIDLGPGVLAFGDGLINYGALGHPPDRYIGDDPEAIKADIVEGLLPLLDEDFDVLLFAHGTPVPSGGKEMLERFLDERRTLSGGGR
jgi:glyoxylase-like metal-dependent hydrolase (beta-lactamase superfamily II)